MADLWTHYNADEREKFFKEHPTDCNFLVGIEGKENPTEIKSYKFILNSISPVFECMFNGNFIEESSTDAIVINDATAKDFKDFLQMAYYKELKLEDVNWAGVYWVAKKYLAETIIGFIISELGHFILSNPNPIDSLHYFEIVHMEDKPKLFSVSLMGALHKAFKMHCFQIYRLDYKIFKSLYIYVRNIDPLVRFRVLENYCYLNKMERSNYDSEENDFIDACLDAIEFSAITLQEYKDFVEKSPLLTLSQKYDILMRISEKLAVNSALSRFCS